MNYRKLGNTDIDVSVIALGGWALAADSSEVTWGKQDERDSLATIDAALDEGINFIDTAEGYSKGASEELIGRALKGRRDRMVVATKAGRKNLAPEKLIQACEGSLRRLQMDMIDLYQLHWADPEVPLEDTLGALSTLRDQGKIRAFGVCNFGPGDLSDLVKTGTDCASNQLAYSLLARAIEYEIQPLCMEHNIGILCYSPLAQGLLTGKFRTADDVPAGRARTRHFSSDRTETRHGESGCETETFRAIEKIRNSCDRLGRPMEEVALAWLLHQPAVTSVLAGARNPEQLRRNTRAAAVRLDKEVLDELAEATEVVKHALGPNADLWMGGDNSRMR